MTKRKQTYPHHAQLHLPYLETKEALLLVEILERAQRAIWRAHGDKMAEYFAHMGIDNSSPDDVLSPGKQRASNDF